MSDPVALLNHLSELPFITAHLPAVSGTLKSIPEDFCVEEIPSYTPTGEGEHLYVFFEKRGLNTPDAVRAIAQQIGTRSEDAGWAGLKDRQAITRQWVSFHHVGTPTLESINVAGVRILEVSRHVNKLRTGHLRGNRFTLRLRDVPPEHDAHISQAIATMRDQGLPNYYGEQRFGQAGRNLVSAMRWIVDGERAPQKPFLRKLFVSTLQSALFNAWLGARVRRGQLAHAIAGDVMRKEETGGVFDCEDVQIDGPRVTSWEISPTGPMFGSRMRATTLDAKAQEDAVLASWGVTPSHFDQVKKFGEGTRRTARVRPDNFEIERDDTDLLLRFELPKGSYATVLVSELLKVRAINLTDDP